MWDKFRIALFHAVSWMARVILLALVTVMPWWYGGAQWQAQWWVVVGGLAVAVTTWLATLLSPRRTGGYVRLSLVMVAFMGWTAIALLPLPQVIASRVSGAQRFVKSVQSGAEAKSERTWLQPESYNTASISPAQTRASLAVLAVAVVVVWSASTLFLSKQLALVLAITLVVGGAANAALGLSQLVSHSQWTTLPMPKDSKHFATFVSRNSAPAYYACATASCLAILGLTYRAEKRKRRKDYRVTYPGESWVGRLRNRFEEVFIDLNSVAVACVLAVAFLLLVTLATFSRGGILGCLAACVVTLCLTLGARGASYSTAVALAVTMLLSVGGGLTLLQLNEPIYSRLDQIDNALQNGNDTRWVVWGYTLHALPTYWLTGCGLGTFRFALQPFHLAGPNVWFHHAESVPLEVLLETGLPGIAIAAYALFIVLKTLYKHSQLQKEYVLLAAAIFATCAIGVQALVDFSLFLPGVFLPYCALLGAFLGRARRIEQDISRLDELGVAALDARTVSKLPQRTPTPGKVVGQTVIALATVCAMAMGLPSLSGYAVAERLDKQLDKQSADLLEAFAAADSDKQENSSPKTATPQEVFQAVYNATGAALPYSLHPEVALAVGRAELFLWRLHATDGIEWGPLSQTQRWELSNPQVLSSILRMKDPKVQELQAKINAHGKGLEFGRESLDYMQQALSACPQDARPAWGMLGADCNWLTPGEHDALLQLLSRVTGNNSQVMVEVAVTAIREGNVVQGLKLLKHAWEIDWSKMNANNMNAIARGLSVEQLLTALPANPVKQAIAAEMLGKLAADPRDPLPDGAALADALAGHVYGQLPKAEPASVEQWRALIWVAGRRQDYAGQASMLRNLALLVPSDFSVKYELAEALEKHGEYAQARKVLLDLAETDSRAAVQYHAIEKIKKIEDSMAKPQ